MTELVVAFLKLVVRNPHRHALALIQHPPIYVPLEILLVPIRMGPKGTDPELALESTIHAVDCIVQTSVAMRVGLDVPCRLVATEGRIRVVSPI